MTDPKFLMSRRHVLVAGVASAALLPFGIGAAHAAKSDTLVVAVPVTPQSLDVEFDVSTGTIDVTGALYDGLLAYETIADEKTPQARRENTIIDPSIPNGGLHIKGKLVESWEIDPANKWVRFTLRKGVLSNWGNELTAEDVLWSWQRKLTLKSIGSFWVGILGIKDLDGFKVEDKHSFRLDLKEPNPLLLSLQPALYAVIWDSVKCKQMATTDDPWARKFLESNSAGFGPYVIKQLTRGQQAVLSARDDYWGEKPAFKNVIMREVPSSATRTSLLEGGAVDIAQYLQPLELKKLATAPGVAVDSIEASAMLAIFLNCKVAPFDKPDVRQAMNFLFPQQEIVDSVFQGLASPMKGAMPNIYSGYDPSFFSYKKDVAKAKELLAKAGYPDGFETTIAYNAGDPTHEPIAVIYQTALREVGIKLTLKKIPAATFFNAVSAREQPMIIYIDAPWVPDAGYSMSLYFNSNSFVDYSSYKNDTVDSVLNASEHTADIAKRKTMMAEVQKTVVDEAPWVFGVYPGYHFARRKDVAGFTYYTSNTIRFQDLRREG